MPYRPPAQAGLGRHGRPVSHHLVGLHLVEQAKRNKALAQREGGITHLRQQSREAGIGAKPHAHEMTPLERAFLGRQFSRQHQRVTQKAVAGAHPGALAHLIGGIGNNPVGTLRALTGVDLNRVAHPVRALQQDYHQGDVTAAAYKRGDITKAQAVTSAPRSEGMILSGPGGDLKGLLSRIVGKGRAAEAASGPAAAGAEDIFGKRTITRARTQPEAEARLRVLDRKLEGFYRKVGKSIGHPLAESDIAQEVARGGAPIRGGRARGRSVEGRVTGAPVKRTSVPEQLRNAVHDHLQKIIERNPNNPAVKGFLSNVAERDALVQSLHGHFPGEAPQGELGQVSYEAPGPGEVVSKSLGAARRARAEQKKLYSAERSARVARGQQAMEEAGGGIAGFKAAMEQQRGELPKVTFERLREGNLKTADVEALVRHAQNHPELSFWEKQNVTKSLLDAVEHGRTPTPSEIKLLQTTYGQDAAAALARVSRLKKAGQIAVDVANIPRTVMASVDMSAPFRQGLVAGARHPSLFVQNFKPMVKAFGSERVYQAVLDDIHARPTFPQMEEAGVKFTELGRDMGKREEQFISRSAGSLPLVKSSARAYTAFLDKMRADMFDRQLELARKQGVNVEDRSELRSIARVVNSATGRGDLGPVEQWAPALNAFFFSPRLIASRVNMLNPVWYGSLTPFARKQALISMIRLGSVAGGVLGLGAYAGAKVTTDPRSSDFAKLRIGNTRADVLGGFQQYIRVGSQLASGKVISSTTGKTMTLGPGFGDLSRKDILERFVVGKFSPPPSFVNDFFTGTQFDGSPFSLKKAILARTIPLVVQDAYDLYKNSDSIPLALLGYSISAFGIGMQTYGPKQKKPVQLYGGSAPRPSGGSSNSLLRSGSGSNSHSLLRGP